jgi:mycothiol synthase
MMMVAMDETPPPPAPESSGIRYRRYRDLDDIPAMARVKALLRRHCGVLGPVDVDAMTHDFRHLVGSEPTADCLLAELDTRVAAYGRASWRDHVNGLRVHHASVVVEPAVWGHGIGEALLDWVESRHVSLAAAHPTDRPRWLEIEVWDGDDELRAAVERAGYRSVRRFAEMARLRLDDELPDHPLPPGYRVQPVTRDQLRSVWEMEVAAFREHWGEAEATETDYAAWADDPRLDPTLIVVAAAGGEIASVVEIKLELLPDGSRRGLLDGVATHPAHRRRGLARALIGRSLRILREAGASGAYLGVDMENANRALELYGSCGFAVASRGSSYRRPFNEVATR